MIWRTVTIFLVLLNGGVPVRGQNCQNQDQQCNCNTNGLTFGGPGGNIVNVAFGKPATLSSALTDSQGTSGPGCMLVNGRTSTLYRTPTEADPNCVHTGHGDFAASWSVDLGRQYTITKITIYRREGNQRRMAGLSVLVGNGTTKQTCYSFPNSSDNTALDALPEQIDITCDPPLTGHKVWLQKHGQDTNGAYFFINVCEVQVWACKDGVYGQNCAQDCSRNCHNGDPCNNYYGYCPAGCREGYTGADCTCGRCRDGVACDGTTKICPGNRCDKGWQTPYCNQTCPAGRYGDDCAQLCGSCKNNDACNAETGICLNGCRPGKTGDLCKQDCPDGYYGDGCSNPCGNCTGDAVCDKVNGTCPTGCQPGFQPSDQLCKTPCAGGTYGVNCNDQCGLCRDGDTTCDIVTGECSACQTNLLAPLCKVCVGNMHGSSCEKNCSDLCGGDGSCDKNSGTCAQGCVTGYTLNGTSCQKCRAGLYGDGCGQSCGQCSGSDCRHDSGMCEAGCRDGYEGSMCADAIQGGPGEGPDIGVAAGGAVAGIVVILVLIAVVLFVVFRRRRSRTKKDGGVRTSRSNAGYANDAEGKSSDDPMTIDPVQSTTESEVNGKSQKPMVAVKPTVQPKPAVNPNDDSGNIYRNIGYSVDPSESGSDQASNPPSNIPSNTPSNPPSSQPSKPPVYSRRQVSAAHSVDPDELEDESPLAEGGHVYGNEDDADVYASFKASEPRLDSVQKYLVDRLATGGLVAEFSDIKKVPDGVVHHAAALPENSKKNRFRLIMPYDKNRIVLQDGYSEDLANDYVNASSITGYYSSKQFIAAQGPRPNTMGDFWRMVWEEKTEHVVMLTNIVENGKTKCEQYWPEEEDETQTYGPVTVTTTDIQCRDDFFVRTFRIKRDGSNQSREVTQYHFTAWPDHGVPTTTSLVTFYRYVSGRTASSGERATAPPVVVHCSAGVGRTGTYIGLDIGIDRAVKDGSVDTLDLVTSLREERCLMVQAVEQYTFLHKALLEAYTAHGTNVSVDTFEELFPQQIASGSPHPRLDKEFKTLQQSLTLQPEQRHETASRKDNITKNRDRTLLPSDSHLAYLNEHVAGRNEFINAVFMPTFRDSRGCVVTQLPLPDTLVDFWRLVYGSGITTVVSLSAPNEEKEVKPYCQYWPTDDGGSVTSGPYDVTLSSKHQLPGSEVTTYSLNIAKKDAAVAKSLQLLHYKGWTGEVGGSSSDILHLIDTLVTSHLNTSTNRLVVQCSDGVKKSGLFCTLVDVINRMTYDREVDVYMTIRHVQSVTPKAITSAVQYRYCYEVVQSRVREMVSIYGNAPAR